MVRGGGIQESMIHPGNLDSGSRFFDRNGTELRDGDEVIGPDYCEWPDRYTVRFTEHSKFFVIGNGCPQDPSSFVLWRRRGSGRSSGLSYYARRPDFCRLFHTRGKRMEKDFGDSD